MTQKCCSVLLGVSIASIISLVFFIPISFREVHKRTAVILENQGSGKTYRTRRMREHNDLIKQADNDNIEVRGFNKLIAGYKDLADDGEDFVHSSEDDIDEYKHEELPLIYEFIYKDGYWSRVFVESLSVAKIYTMKTTVITSEELCEAANELLDVDNIVGITMLDSSDSDPLSELLQQYWNINNKNPRCIQDSKPKNNTIIRCIFPVIKRSSALSVEYSLKGSDIDFG